MFVKHSRPTRSKTNANTAVIKCCNVSDSRSVKIKDRAQENAARESQLKDVAVQKNFESISYIAVQLSALVVKQKIETIYSTKREWHRKSQTSP